MNEVENIFNEEDIQELKSIVNEFINEINNEIQVEFETQFVCSMTEKKVYIGLLPLIQGFKSNDSLQEIYKEKGFEYNNFYIFALLHEIGHIETTKHLEKDVLDFILNAYDFQVNELNKKYKNDKEFLEKYIDLTLEKLANNWALDYYKNNTKKVLDFTEKFFDKFDIMLENILGE